MWEAMKGGVNKWKRNWAASGASEFEMVCQFRSK